MKRVLVVATGMVFLWSGAAWLAADDQGASKCGSETGSACCSAGSCDVALKCPVSGKPISREASLDYKGAKVYFCCSGCIPKFKENAAKYQARANEQLVLSGQFKQVACPLTGGKVSETAKAKVGGVEVRFCCNNCQSKVAKAEPETQCQMVFVKGFDKAFALNQQKKEAN